MAADGLTALVGYEMEFGVYAEGGPDELEPAHRGPAYSPHALVGLDGFVADVLRDFAGNGLEIGQLHAEYGPAQLELSLAATDPVTAADRQLLARQTLRAAAARHGLRLSFAPLPSTGSAGNGWHVHSSVWRDGQNLLAGGPDGPHGRRARATSPGCCATCPRWPRSPRPASGRWPGCGRATSPAPTRFWGVENREAPLRYVPGSALLGPDHANVELKTSDASANPYLALAALLAAGAAGIADGLPLGAPEQSDPGTWTARAAGRARDRRAARDPGRAGGRADREPAGRRRARPGAAGRVPRRPALRRGRGRRPRADEVLADLRWRY